LMPLNDTSNLFDLVGLCLGTKRLEVDDFCDTVLIKNVMIAPNVTIKLQGIQKIHKVTECDIRI
jgi:hypothetical protein